MITKNTRNKLWLLVIFGIIHGGLKAQTKNISANTKKTEFYEIRGTNVLDYGTGTSVIHGEFADPIFSGYFHASYKRYLFPHLNVNIGYNKFNLAYEDIYNERFTSFDLNLESTLYPHYKFSPFIFVGVGYNASNHFKETDFKFQGGCGIEYMVTQGIGLKLYGDYNYVVNDKLLGLISGVGDYAYFRIGFGFNFYFGGDAKKLKILKDQPTIIKSNPIITHN